MSNGKEINAAIFIDMINSAANLLSLKKDVVDKLNVFPVPDGDTGTNMAMTIQSSAKFVNDCLDGSEVGYLADRMSYGALMGARGNSGVILSQVLAGFSRIVKDKSSINAHDLVLGFLSGVDAAYSAVSNPLEGTILTVVREAGEAVNKRFLANMTIEDVFNIYLKEGYQSLSRTPDLLPVLKQAGVVDAGAQGFLFIIEGMLSGYKGELVDFQQETISVNETLNDHFDHFFTDPDTIVYPYCTEFLIQTSSEGINTIISELKGQLNEHGDCMLVVGAGKTIKIHIHTNNLGAVFSKVTPYGELTDIKINNMKEQNRSLQGEPITHEEKEFAIITVANGSGLIDIFKSMGVEHVIHGGQTMNPSTQDFLKVIEQTQAKNIIILPNNKNIIMAAEQAALLATSSHVRVVPSKTIPQGLASLMGFDPTLDVDEITAEMSDMLNDISSGEITTAVRDTKIGNITIGQGEFLAILNGKIIKSDKLLLSALKELVQQMINDGASLVTLYHGAGLTTVDAEEITAQLLNVFPNTEFEYYDGGQNVYYFLVSAE